MAGDGSKDKYSKKQEAEPLEWSSDPLIRHYEEFSRGFKKNEEPIFTEHLYFKLPWMAEAEKAVEDVMALPSGARAEHCVKAAGGTRASKTSFQRAVVRRHPPYRDKHNDLHIPYACFKTPSTPSPAAIDLSILKALGEPAWKMCKGPVERLSRIAEVSEMVGLLGLGLDDFQHLVDTRGERVQHATLDRLKEIGDLIKVPFVYSGLTRMQKAFETNEQCNGRTESTIRFRRLDWEYEPDRKRFKSIARKIIAEFDKYFGKSEFDLDEDGNLFRLYISVGGLIGNLIRVLRVAAAICIKTKTRLTVLTLREAVVKVIAKSSSWPNQLDPFDAKFVSTVSTETLQIAQSIGAEKGPAAMSKRKGGCK